VCIKNVQKSDLKICPTLVCIYLTPESIFQKIEHDIFFSHRSPLSVVWLLGSQNVVVMANWPPPWRCTRSRCDVEICMQIASRVVSCLYPEGLGVFTPPKKREAYPRAYINIRMYRCKEARGRNNVKRFVPLLPHHACKVDQTCSLHPTVLFGGCHVITSIHMRT
jgi:hypothetical protein